MTNILATIVILIATTTNDVPRYEQAEMNDGSYSWLMYYDNLPMNDKPFKSPVHFNGVPPTKEGVRVIQTTKTTTLSFDWNGKSRKVVDVEILDTKKKLLIRKEEWIEANPDITTLESERIK